MDASLAQSNLFVLLLLSGVTSFVALAESATVQLNSNNFDNLVASHEVVFLNFYADWCRFSQILAPVFDEAADKIKADFPAQGKVLFGKVDCDTETALGTRFHISKYPTLKLIRHGFLAKREFRGQRSADALVSYVRDQLKDPVQQLSNKEELQSIDEKKRIVVGYFDSIAAPHYDVFRRVAMNLREDCDFYVGVGDNFQQERSEGEKIFFRPPFGKEGSKDESYTDSMDNFKLLNSWTTDHCIPMVREITFENAEELTEEGLPFLILFHHPDDHEIIEKFTQVIRKNFSGDKAAVNFLTADGLKFAHPLHHLSKTAADLPLIAVDSFRHMYLFPDTNDMTLPGKLRQFIDDLYSGKLHREFHYGPDPTTQTEQEQQPEQQQEQQFTTDQRKDVTTPPESTFKKLGPSRNRYTLLRDEL